MLKQRLRYGLAIAAAFAASMAFLPGPFLFLLLGIPATCFSWPDKVVSIADNNSCGYGFGKRWQRSSVWKRLLGCSL